MKKFNFKYPPIAWVLLAVVLLLALGGLGWNIFNLIELWGGEIVKLASYFIVIIIALILICFAISIMVYGNYAIKGKNIVCNLGFLKTTFNIEEVTQITHFKKSDKLVLYFINGNYTVIVISPEEYERFILAVREVNSKILYSTAIDGEDTPS